MKREKEVEKDIIDRTTLMAKEIADKATEVANKVAAAADETAKKVLLFSQSLEFIKNEISEIKQKLDNKYVTKEEFATVKAIAYGLVGAFMLGIIGGIMALLFKK